MTEREATANAMRDALRRVCREGVRDVSYDDLELARCAIEAELRRRAMGKL